MTHVRRAVACIVAMAVPILLVAPARAASPTVTNAIAYLQSQQNPGGVPSVPAGAGAWDTDPSFQFVTEDAVLAIAEAGQTGATWSASEAKNAVAGTTNDMGIDPLAFLALVEAPLTPSTPDPSLRGPAAKFLVLVAAPLGLDTAALADEIGDPDPNGSFAPDTVFNSTLYAALAKRLVDGAVPASTVAYIASKQGTDGGWSDGFPGDPEDTDTTSGAIQALIAGGVGPTDPIVQRGLAFIASQQNADGTWSAFGSESAESTSRALLAVAAAGYDPNSRCWRDTVDASAANASFVGGDAALTTLANPDGSIAGPGAFLPAYGTAQAVQGLQRSWLPVVRAPTQTCTVVAPEVVADPPAAAPVAVTPAFTG
jgi:hypothetical protein